MIITSQQAVRLRCSVLQGLDKYQTHVKIRMTTYSSLPYLEENRSIANQVGNPLSVELNFIYSSIPCQEFSVNHSTIDGF